MPLCPTCGTTLDAAARFCPKDGTTIKPEPAAPPVAAAAPTARDDGTATRPLTPDKQAKLPESDPLVGATIDGRYRIKARLGQGGVGAVYEGEHVETKRPVALKVLHAIFAGSDEFHKRFEREARAASRLTHPSCVSVIDFGRVDRVEPVSAGSKLLGIPYLVMEFVRGEPLADRVGKESTRRPTPAEAIVIARGILSALRHAHGLGIVHRDIKPANIMLVDHGPGGAGTGLIVKLLDFGLAKVIGDNEGSSAEPLTQAGMVFGTPGYLSPEQASGKPADARSDLYALGVVLYEMLVGRRPFMRPDPLDVVRDHLQTLPPPPRAVGAQISPELEAVVLKALAKDPARRWQSAEELSAALAAVPEMQGVASSSQSQQMAAATKRTPRAPVTLTLDPRTIKIVGAGLAGVLVIFLIVLAARPRTPPQKATPAATKPAVEAPLPTATISPEARRHIELARDYQRRLWCSDAIEELERALKADALAAANPSLQETAIACLTPKTRDKATRLLVERVGAPARSALEAAATGAPNSEVRRGAQLVLERLPR